MLSAHVDSDGALLHQVENEVDLAGPCPREDADLDVLEQPAAAQRLNARVDRGLLVEVSLREGEVLPHDVLTGHPIPAKPDALDAHVAHALDDERHGGRAETAAMHASAGGNTHDRIGKPAIAQEPAHAVASVLDEARAERVALPQRQLADEGPGHVSTHDLHAARAHGRPRDDGEVDGQPALALRGVRGGAFEKRHESRRVPETTLGERDAGAIGLQIRGREGLVPLGSKRREQGLARAPRERAA